MMLFHQFQLKQIHSTQNKHSSVSFIHFSSTLFHSCIHFKRLWITNSSNLSNCLLGEEKICFRSTNNNLLIFFFFSIDVSYEYRTVDNCFFSVRLTFVRIIHNIGTSIQGFTWHHTWIYGQKFYITPKIVSR